MRTSLSMDNCALRGEEEEECQVFFSNQEYYWRLEELKKTHLRNMAELEKMYIGRSNGGHQRLPHDLGLGSGENRSGNPLSLLLKVSNTIQVNTWRVLETLSI